MIVMKTKINAIKQGDPKFYITDGMIVYPRAMIHVLPEGPHNVRETLEWSVSNGYVKTMAHVYGKELTMDAMR